MVTLNYIEKINPVVFPEGTTENKRNLSKAEIEILLKNGNVSDFEDWSNVLVSSIDGEFNPQLIYNSHFSGFVVLGRIKHAVLKFHDLELVAGIYNSNLIDVIVSDDVVIRNVKYLKNYRIGNRVILFNIQEMSCMEHSKLGNGWLKN